MEGSGAAVLSKQDVARAYLGAGGNGAEHAERTLHFLQPRLTATPASNDAPFEIVLTRVPLG